MSILWRGAFHFEHAVANVEIALRIWNFDAGGGEMLVNQKIQIALESARAMAHFLTPDDQLKIDCAITELLQKYAWLGLF